MLGARGLRLWFVYECFVNTPCGVISFEIDVHSIFTLAHTKGWGSVREKWPKELAKNKGRDGRIRLMRARG